MVAEVIGKRRGGMCLVDRCTDNGLMVLPRRWGGGNVGGLVRFGKEQEDGNKGVLE